MIWLLSLNSQRPLRVRLGFGKADDFRAFLELAALLQKFDAFETLQDIPFRGDRAGSL